MEPVVATLLMVAITVVLASVLYVIVMSYGDIIPREPIGTFTSATRSTPNSEKLAFSSFRPEVKFLQCQLRIDPPGDAADAGASELWSFTDNLTTPYIYNGTVTITVTDLAQDGKISQGDHVTITWGSGYTPAGQWTVKLLHAATGNELATVSFIV